MTIKWISEALGVCFLRYYRCNRYFLGKQKWIRCIEFIKCWERLQRKFCKDFKRTPTKSLISNSRSTRARESRSCSRMCPKSASILSWSSWLTTRNSGQPVPRWWGPSTSRTYISRLKTQILSNQCTQIPPFSTNFRKFVPLSPKAILLKKLMKENKNRKDYFPTTRDFKGKIVK